MKNKWNIVYEADDENGNPAMWSCEINHEKYGRFCWIIDNGDHFSVEVKREGSELSVLAKCKSLVSAKRWATMNLL